MPTTFAKPFTSREMIRVKDGTKTVCLKNCYMGAHPDVTAIAKYGNLWFKIIGTDSDGYRYIDLANGAYAL